MHAIVRFRSDLPATHMVHLLNQAWRYGIGVDWEELTTVEEDGRLWPEAEIEWSQNEAASAWFGSMGIACVYVEEEA